ncbi:Sugar-specific transcriptional regulator TrmB [Halanaeroarchaeum sp. HSR-CO]|uniref:TrmB family transcriptional regulator n=1 Tax=Halanaeroarchaeum sp. HSR-CO TaxID=2866382 RepID=UPI00217ED6D5|nr:TrmB family transcriptional regulator [Halanaeroarchaeum sp. HSR-CO]UWG48820.1 Sugar-specific transcriptional regulator TrmB [Halanaeroarchaeum sp. HSR-CO]
MADLKDLGLSEYEANAYRALLETGPATAKELSEASGVPMGRIYDVLGSIESQHLVRSQAASRPKKYVAVEPDTALDRLLEDRKRELEEKADQYEAIVGELTTDLENPADPEDGFWTGAIGPENSLELLLERIDAAENELRIITGTPSSSFEVGEVGGQVIDHLEAALESGVGVSMLIDLQLNRQLPADITERYASAIVGYENFEVRVASTIDGNITIVDDREVCLEVLNPVDPDESFALINLKDAGFTAEVTDEFEPIWRDAERL